MASQDAAPDAAAGPAEPPAQITREELYEEVWRVPMLRIGERHGVSSSYLARVCTSMNVPRPAPGYWAKVEFGKAPPRPPLPQARAEDKLVWNRSDDPDIVVRPLPKPPIIPRLARSTIVDVRAKRHPLVDGVRGLFTKGRTVDAGFLKPSKKLLVDIVVSEKLLDPALETANELFQHLESAGHRVMLAPTDQRYGREPVDEREVSRQGYHHSSLWSPHRPTVVFVGTVAIGLTLFETTEAVEVRHLNGEDIPLAVLAAEKRKRFIPHWSWTSTKDYMSGRLCLQAYCPYPVASWSRQWRETDGNKLKSQVGGIVAAMVKASEEIARLVEEGERKAEIERREWEERQRRWAEERERERLAKAQKESREALLQAIAAWDEAKRIQAFFGEAAAQARESGTAEMEAVRERLALARELIGDSRALDALKAWKAPHERG